MADDHPVEKIYQKKTQIEHILLRPDTYIGSTDPQEQLMWIMVKGEEKFREKEISFVPGLYKIFDEILVNAADNIQRDKKCNTIKVNINKSSISVWNNGKGIPIEIHKEHGCYVPELVFGHLLTSSNYDDKQKKVTGGRNGYGAKLTNIFSKKFIVETQDTKRKKHYRQEFQKNMSIINPPQITAIQGDSEDYTLVSFEPDLKKFRMSCLDEDTIALLSKRVYDLAGCTPASIKVYLNGKQIKIGSFENYVDLYMRTGKEVEKFYEKCSDRWEICIAVLPDQYQFQQVSFVNSICTLRGGTHVYHVTDQIINRLMELINKKHKNLDIKFTQVKQHLWAFVNCLIENPAFDSQTKETLTTKHQQFGSACQFSDKFFNKLAKSSLIENIVSSAEAREQSKLIRSLGTKTKKERLYGVPKLEDANLAGTKRSMECTLILTEGDSAKSLAMSGIQVAGRDKFGVFPLKGKFLNVRDANIKQMGDNDEVQNLIKIMGLQINKQYQTREELHSLRYGSIMIMTDQDHDGSHIKGLLINFLHFNWPNLIRLHPGFLKEFITPIIKAQRGNEKHSFFTIPEYERWAQANHAQLKKYKIKYYKGLGTSTSLEAKEYFGQMEKHRIRFKDDESIDLAFNKKKADDRKQWLSNYNPKIYVDHNQKELRYYDFIHRELIHFSNADNLRSIPSMIDGFKPGQRKIIFSCFKRKLKNEIKVAQLAGYVAEHSAYHHGEVSLCQTIIGMAQDFVGSNNINILQPIGQFGTRMMGGKEAASPRYIFTNLCEITRLIFKEEDDPILNYQIEEGQKIEPEYYAPIIPMSLVNGADGIGTGWSTSIPCYNPLEICDNIRYRLLNKDSKRFRRMTPWFRGYTGFIQQKEDGSESYYIYGCFQTNRDILTITELPIQQWTRNYKNILEELAQQDVITDIKEFHKDNTIKFELTVPGLQEMSNEEIIQKFKLQSSLSCNNFVLFDQDYKIKRYQNEVEILEEFFQYRKEMYRQRKEDMMNRLEQLYEEYRNQHQFIQDIIHGKLQIFNKKKAEIIELLREKGFKTYEEIYSTKDSKLEIFEIDQQKEKQEEESNELNETSYDPKNRKKVFGYLLNMNILTFSHENLSKLTSDMDETNHKLKQLQASSIEDLWIRDLDEFEQEYRHKCLKLDEPQVITHKNIVKSSNFQIQSKTNGSRGQSKHLLDEDESMEEEKTFNSSMQPQAIPPVPVHRKIINMIDKNDQSVERQKHPVVSNGRTIINTMNGGTKETLNTASLSKDQKSEESILKKDKNRKEQPTPKTDKRQTSNQKSKNNNKRKRRSQEASSKSEGSSDSESWGNSEESEAEVTTLNIGSSTRPNAVKQASDKSPITPNAKTTLNGKEKSIKADKSSSIGKQKKIQSKRIDDEDSDEDEDDEESPKEVIIKRTSQRRSAQITEFTAPFEKSPVIPKNRREQKALQKEEQKSGGSDESSEEETSYDPDKFKELLQKDASPIKAKTPTKQVPQQKLAPQRVQSKTVPKQSTLSFAKTIAQQEKKEINLGSITPPESIHNEESLDIPLTLAERLKQCAKSSIEIARVEQLQDSSILKTPIIDEEVQVFAKIAEKDVDEDSEDFQPHRNKRAIIKLEEDL